VSATRDTSTAGVLWHDVECGGYEADLPLWRTLAEEATGSLLELGCGTGRVALALARDGHKVVGVDTDRALVDAFNERARADGLDAHALCADIRHPHPPGPFGLVLAPMQILQLLDGPADRERALRAAALRLGPGAALACAIVEGAPEEAGLHGADDETRPLPDVREHGGWVYSSLPLGASVEGDALIVSRLRQVVSPDGELREELHRDQLAVLTAAELEREAAAAGLRVRERLDVPESEAHIGSAVLVLEAAP
jgi:SAM-dependent methyltransferase